MRIRDMIRALGLALVLSATVAACTSGEPSTAQPPQDIAETPAAAAAGADPADGAGQPGEPPASPITNGSDQTPSDPTAVDAPGAPDSGTADTPADVAACDVGASATSWTSAPVAESTRIATEPLVVDAVVYPRPDYEGRPWSQWGQGIVAQDGRFISAIGDHLGVDGNSYLYAYDPIAGTLVQIADALTLAGHSPGAWGYGKVHAQMVPGPCGDIYLTTYWGTRRDLVFGDGYEGDLLFRLDAETETIANLGVLHDRHGVPSLASHPGLGLLYAEAVDPTAPPGGSGSFVVVDMVTGKTVAAHHDPNHAGFRSVAVAANGDAYYSLGEGRLARFDPTTGAVDIATSTIPGEVLRAVTPPTPDGSVLGVTDGPANFFEMTAEGEIRTIGPADGYTTSVAVSPDGGTIYSVPDAHGGAWRNGTPLIATDVATGESRTLMRLNDPAEAAMGLRLGGTYSLALTPDGSTLYIGMNAAEPNGDREAFGEVVLLIVELP